MKRFLLFSLLFLLILPACRQPSTPIVSTRVPPSIPTETPMPPTPQPEPTVTPIASVTLQRGINFGNTLEAPNEGEWGLRIQEEYFDLIKEAGFDFVRLPVRWNTHAEADQPFTINPGFFMRVDEVVNWALKRNLNVIIDFHHYEEMAVDPRSHKDQFLGIWKQVAAHYKDYPLNVLFELLNEPNGQLDAAVWNEHLKEALAIVRKTNPTRDVVIGPTLWNAYNMMPSLDVPEDQHLIVTFHYYLPFQFTHQGAEWVEGSDTWLGMTWDATNSEKAEITSHFDLVSEWAKRKNVSILLGEFGAYSKADMPSRVRWTEYVTREAERHGFAWAYWEFGSGFGVYDPDTKVWREELLKALNP